MDFDKLQADKNLILTKHFTKGRGGKKIDKVIIHYNAGDLSIEGCYSVWQTRAASAHYQVESSGRIGQLVWDADTAWHAGSFNQNQRSIGVEHANQGDTFTDACIESGAHLVAALCKYYGLGRPEWRKNVFPHWDFQSTSCPAGLGRGYNARYMKRAQEWYDSMTGTTTTTKQETTTTGVDLGDLRYWGPSFTTELQKQLGTTVDGIVSGQSAASKRYHVNCDASSWKYGSGGSQMVRALQKKLGVTQDGYCGPNTIRAIQGFVGVTQDGFMGPATCTAVGNALKAGKFK